MPALGVAGTSAGAGLPTSLLHDLDGADHIVFWHPGRGATVLAGL
jgi:hypothetical protein